MQKLLIFLCSMTFLLGNNLVIKSIDEVTKIKKPSFIEVNSKDATLEFVSSVPLSCTIVYGTSKQYGHLTNDPNMSSALTINHKPILSNLKPDTLYHARVQGLDANGIMYVGKNMTFKTKKVSLTALKNNALLSNGAIISKVSSNWNNGANSSSYGANKAIDGNKATAWSSNSDGDNAFISISFPKKIKTKFIKVWTRTMSNNTAQIFSFNITNDKGEVFGPFNLPSATKAYKFELKTKTQTLKLQALKTNTGNTGLVEFEVY